MHICKGGYFKGNNKFVFKSEPNLYLTLFGISMQVVASIPVVIHKQRLKTNDPESDDSNQMRGPSMV